MESAFGMNISLDPQDSFKVVYVYLKLKVEYIFISSKMKPNTWRVAYWSVKVQRGSIMKFGTKEDKLRLLAVNGRNKTRNQRDRINSGGRELKRRRIRKVRYN